MPYIAKDSEEEDELCLFIGSLLAALPDLGPNMDVESAGKYISDQICNKWESLAKTPITSRPHGTSWWNDECQAYRDAYNLARTKENFKAYNAVTHKACTASHLEPVPPPSYFGHSEKHPLYMPSRRGGAPPGPSSGPQGASASDRLFPSLFGAAVKLKPTFADLDPDAVRRAFRNAWLVRPPPPNDLHAASALLVSVANRLARAARRVEDPFESAASSPAPSVSPIPLRSPSLAGDLTLPHIEPQDAAAAAPTYPPVTPPSMRSLLEALFAKDQDDFRALDEAATSLLRDLVAKLTLFVSSSAPLAVDVASSPRPSAVPALPVPKVPVAVPSADPLTKP
ncbi:hypothetical protein AX14_010718, partial [Amanita brunnescens Koide BX004]